MDRPHSYLLDQVVRHLVVNEPIVLEQRIRRVKNHCTLQFLAAEPRAFVKLANFFQEFRRQMRGVVIG